MTPVERCAIDEAFAATWIMGYRLAEELDRFERWAKARGITCHEVGLIAKKRAEIARAEKRRGKR